MQPAASDRSHSAGIAKRYRVLLLGAALVQITGYHTSEDGSSLYRKALECDAVFAAGQKQYGGENGLSDASESNGGVLLVYTLGLGRALGKSSKQIGDDIRLAIKKEPLHPPVSVIDATKECLSSAIPDDLYSND